MNKTEPYVEKVDDGFMAGFLKTLGALASFAVIAGLLAIVLFSDNGLLSVPLVAFVWLLVLREKGYFIFALPLFLLSNTIFMIFPGVWSGFAAIASMILLALLPARRRVMGKWTVASKNGTWRAWLLPTNAQEDTGAIVGDASIHLIVVVGLVLFFGIWATVGF